MLNFWWEYISLHTTVEKASQASLESLCLDTGIAQTLGKKCSEQVLVTTPGTWRDYYGDSHCHGQREQEVQEKPNSAAPKSQRWQEPAQEPLKAEPCRDQHFVPHLGQGQLPTLQFYLYGCHSKPHPTGELHGAFPRSTCSFIGSQW
jgi:hypothetical protein